MPRGAKPIDIAGQRFGRLTVSEMTDQRMHKNVMWRCTCDCGNTVVVGARDLRTGHTRSCGCLKLEMLKTRVTRHGAAGTRLYMIWQEMLARCYRAESPSFKFYGARGISVCDEWRTSFESFAADMGDPPFGCSLERKNNDMNYSKDNCQWATHTEQMNNRRGNIIISFNGREMTMAQFARFLGFHYAKVRSAIKRGVTSIGGYEISVSKRK